MTAISRCTLAALILTLTLAACRQDQVAPAPDAEGDLMESMAFMQRYFEKAHMAGAAANWSLAAFYVHELEEVGESVRTGGVEVGGVELAALIDSHFLPAIHRLDEAVDLGANAFQAALDEVVVACNACHAATGYGFVRIVVPEETRPYASQAFSP